MDQEQCIKERILKATIQVFNQKGLKFTMDDVARELNMSKKTIYSIFRTKESMLFEMVEYSFDKIKESEREVLEDATTSNVEKLRLILGVLPEGYRDIDLSQLYSLKDKYPKIYQKVEKRLESGWEKTFELLERGMEAGEFRRVNIPIYKVMLEATIEQFFQRDILVQNKISYSKALDEVVGILVDGIVVRK